MNKLRTIADDEFSWCQLYETVTADEISVFVDDGSRLTINSYDAMVTTVKNHQAPRCSTQTRRTRERENPDAQSHKGYESKRHVALLHCADHREVK